MVKRTKKGRKELFNEEPTIRTTVVIPKRLHDKAKYYGLSLSTVLTRALEDWISRLEGNTKHDVREQHENTLSNGGSVRNTRARSSGGLEHRPAEPGVAGSSPAGPAPVSFMPKKQLNIVK